MSAMTTPQGFTDRQKMIAEQSNAAARIVAEARRAARAARRAQALAERALLDVALALLDQPAERP
jgi:hypothetical protein